MIAAPVRVQPLFEYELELGGRHTRVLELEGAGPPVLLLHGYADSADTWRLVLAQLARAGQRAVAIDLPGFGRADALAPGAILPQLDDIVDAAVTHAGGRPRQPVIVVGNSLGGCLAIRAGARVPDRIAGVMAAAPAGYDMKRLISLIEYDPLLHTLLGLPTPIPSAVIKASAARIYCQLAFASVRGIDPQVVASFVSHISGRARAATYLDIGHRLVPELRDALTLETMRLPLLVVWGKRDRMLAASGAEKILAALPETRLELLDGIGHCPQVEAPARFAELLIEFAEAQVRAGADADASTGRAAV